MRVIYRISDGSYVKDKLPNATKQHCLLNLLSHFPKEEVVVLADKLNDDTRAFLDAQGEDGLDVRYISGGSSAQSFRIGMELAITYPDDEVVYQLEDDYLHIDDCRKHLLEAIQAADYVTLVDYPDKYRSATGGAGTCPWVNPLVQEMGEMTQLIFTGSRHWKITNSTTCTFATTSKTLKEDWEIWKRHCFATPVVMHPHDFECFLDLTKTNSRSLISPVPTLATHCELNTLATLVDWYNV